MRGGFLFLIASITHRLSHDAQANYFYCVLCLTKWRFNEAQHVCIFNISYTRITKRRYSKGTRPYFTINFLQMKLIRLIINSIKSSINIAEMQSRLYVLIGKNERNYIKVEIPKKLIQNNS